MKNDSSYSKLKGIVSLNIRSEGVLFLYEKRERLWMRTYGVRYFTRFGNISRSGIGVAELKFTANGTAWAQRKCGMRDMRWCVMQSMKHKKWILAVMNNDSTAYEVTDVMSDNVKKIIQYADYLNLVNSGKGIEAGMLERLEQLRLCYEMKESQVQMT